MPVGVAKLVIVLTCNAGDHRFEPRLSRRKLRLRYKKNGLLPELLLGKNMKI